MARAIVLRAHGGPAELREEEVAVGSPGPGEVRLRQTAVGVNFHDVYVRTGLYQTLPLPGVPGIEGVGVVEEVGADVTGLAVGDRVGYVSPQYGAYASERLLPAAQALPLPAAIGDVLAATLLLKGLTAEMLLRHVHPVERGMTILVHAAAGGVGRFLCQWGAALGATVIGTVGSEAKAAVAHAAGAAHVIRYRDEDVVAEVRRATAGRGVDVVYDSVGADTFDASLDALAPLGHLVSFGQSSGPPAPLAMARLATRSLGVSRPILFHYLADAARQRAMAASVLGAFADGTLRLEPGRTFPLADAAGAHALLESRAADGALVLVPAVADA